MRELREEEMFLIEGGANTIVVTSVIAAVITFFVGIFHGYANPKGCNN